MRPCAEHLSAKLKCRGKRIADVFDQALHDSGNIEVWIERIERGDDAVNNPACKDEPGVNSVSLETSYQGTAFLVIRQGSQKLVKTVRLK